MRGYHSCIRTPTKEHEPVIPAHPLVHKSKTVQASTKHEIVQYAQGQPKAIKILLEIRLEGSSISKDY